MDCIINSEKDGLALSLGNAKGKILSSQFDSKIGAAIKWSWRCPLPLVLSHFQKSMIRSLFARASLLIESLVTLNIVRGSKGSRIPCTPKRLKIYFDTQTNL